MLGPDSSGCWFDGGRWVCDGPCGFFSHSDYEVAWYLASESCRGDVTVRIVYPSSYRLKAYSTAMLFAHKRVRIEFKVDDSIDDIIIIGPNWVTSDPTRATALARISMLDNKTG